MLLLTLCASCQQSLFQRYDRLAYIESEKPNLKAKVFAPEFISRKDASEFGSVFNKEGTAFYYAIESDGRAEIWYTEMVDKQWAQPVAIISHPEYGFNDPFLSPNEQRLFYISQMPRNELDSIPDHDIWYSEKRGKGWSDPINAGAVINSEQEEYYISFTNEGALYFASNKGKERKHDFDIYRSELLDGVYQTQEKLSDSINTRGYEGDVFISPDESYIIFCAARKAGFGKGDLYISFKRQDGEWTESVNMGSGINTEGHELCPFVTRDGKFFFYTSNQDIYWVSTSVFDHIKSK